MPRVIQPQFDDAQPFSEGLAVVGVRDAEGAFKEGYIDKTGKVIRQGK